LLAALLVFLFFWTSPAHARSPRIEAILARIDSARIAGDVSALAALGTRMAILPGFSRATDLVRARMEQAGLQVELDPFPMGDDLQVSNVVALLPAPGSGRPAILVTAHYDSIAFPDASVAPGAEDNGSGTAALLELGRVLAGEKLATELRLVAFAGEEEGLWGSRHLARTPDLAQQIQAVINMDMVGFHPVQARPEVVLDGPRLARSLIGRLAWTSGIYGGPRTSGGIFSAARSDHRPFADLGIPALTIASLWVEAHPHYHTADDLPVHVDPQMVAAVTRLVAARVLLMAGFADGGPVARAGAFVDASPGDQVSISASDSFDPGGLSVDYRWQQLDGPPAAIQGDGQTLSLTVSEPGAHRFVVVARTSDGRESEPELAAVVVQEAGCSVGGSPGPAEAWLLLLLALLVRLRRRAAPAR